MKSAPVVDAEERAILSALAESAWSDGTDAFPSKKTIAEIAVIDPKTVQRRLRTLASRGLIAEGNQDAAAYIPEYFRPKVYDLMIPYSWFPDIDQVNAERKAKGKRPLTPEDRPDLAPAPPKKHRADKGKPRPKKAPGDSQGGGDYKSPGTNQDKEGMEEGTTSPGGGDYKSTTRGLQDPQPSPANPPQDTPRPSVPEESSPEDMEGGTDGAAVPHQIGRNPGVDLLLAIGAQQPEFLLTGQTLQDQGMAVAGMLMQGWTREQVRQVVAGRPLPDPIRTTVGAVVARRLRDALAGPAPHVGQFKADWVPKDTPTPTPAPWNVETVAPHARPGECEGKDGMCGRPTDPGDAFCRHCRKDVLV
jgi:hypothetical protein